MPYNGKVHTGRWIGDAHPEVDAPKEGRWIARPRKSRWVPQVFGGVFLMSQLPNWLNIVFGNGEHGPAVRIVVFALFGILAAMLLYVALQRRLAGRIRAEDAALMDAAFGDQYPVEVTVVVEDRRIGTDRGVVWFDEGLMGFSGRASSFVLAASDLRPWSAAARKGNGRRPLPSDAILLRDAPKAAYLLVTPLNGYRRAYRERLRAFFHGEGRTADERLAEFMQRPDVPLGERFWPPLEPYTEGVRAGERQLRA